MAKFPTTQAAASDGEEDNTEPQWPRRDAQAVWERLSADLPGDSISWRQDGKPTERDGKWTARYVCYVEAGTIRERLDQVVPGEWDLTLELLPPREIIGEGGKLQETEYDEAYAFKARLQVLGVIREDIGTGHSYKQAATDAFKRASVRFGIGHELYDMPALWVEVDGGGKYAKPLEDPQLVFQRKFGKGARGARPVDDGSGEPTAGQPALHRDDPDEIRCPKCDGRMWDNRLTKRNPKAPDYKCRDRNCDGVVWPPKEADRQVDALLDTSEPEIQGSVSTTRTIPAKPAPAPQAPTAQGKTLPGETKEDLQRDDQAPRQVPGKRAAPRSTPPSQRGQDEFPAALRDEEDDLPF